jgi:hypothetical protein
MEENEAAFCPNEEKRWVKVLYLLKKESADAGHLTTYLHFIANRAFLCYP